MLSRPTLVAIRAKPNLISRRLSIPRRGLKQRLHSTHFDASTQICILPDGRWLCFAEYGDPSGTPCFFFHGTPGSRLSCGGLDEVCRELKTRLISVDRPGCGLSTFKPGYRYVDWPADIQALAKYLGLGRFRVCGTSGGGPYALACASQIPSDVLACTGVIAGAGPPELKIKNGTWADWFELPEDEPRSQFELESAVTQLYGMVLNDPKALEERIRTLLKFTEDDLRALDRYQDMLAGVANNFREAMRQGATGYARDIYMQTRPWGFDLSEIKGRVKMFYGENDANTPSEIGDYLSTKIQNTELTIFPGMSHYTLVTFNEYLILGDISHC